MDPTLHSQGGRGEAFRTGDINDLDEFAYRAAVTNGVIKGDPVPVSWKGQLRSILTLPFTVTVTIPAVLLVLFGPVKVSWQKWGLLGPVLMFLGSASVLMGLSLMISTIWLFATVGKRTLVPWDPTESLVVRGPYRFVRNPMISRVTFVLLGEALILDLVANWLWFVIFTIGNMIYIPMSEEKGLQERFGNQFQRCQANVPCWFPRLTAWNG